MKESHLRSVVKGVSWRITGTLDTMLLSYIFTGNVFTMLKIGVSELFTKILLYYLHERAWGLISFGRKRFTKEDGTVFIDDSRPRSFIKGVSWRFFGTMDTILLALFWTGDFQTAFNIGITELFTKVALFYFHERLWTFISWGKKPAPDSGNSGSKPEVSNTFQSVQNN